MSDWLDPSEQAMLLERLRCAIGERKREIASLSREEYMDAIAAIEALAKRNAVLEARRIGREGVTEIYFDRNGKLESFGTSEGGEP